MIFKPPTSRTSTVPHAMTTRATSSSAVATELNHRARAEGTARPIAGGLINALGVVTGALPGGVYTVISDDMELRCQRAASCLLRPEIGDTVLVCGPDAQRLYLTAVAEQADARESRIDVSGDLTLASTHGSVAVESETALHLRGKQSLDIGTSQFKVDASAADCRVGRLTYQGDEMEATVLNIRVIGRLYEAVMDRLVHLSRTAFRMTEGVDQVRAGRIDYQAEETVRVHAKDTLVTATRLAKVDARQIHMG